VPNSVSPSVSHLLSVTFFARLLQRGVLGRRRRRRNLKNIEKSFVCRTLLEEQRHRIDHLH